MEAVTEPTCVLVGAGVGDRYVYIASSSPKTVKKVTTFGESDFYETP
jgi:hypothetical protein